MRCGPYTNISDVIVVRERRHLGVRSPAWSPCSIATLPSELLAPESTAVQTFTQKVTVTLNYGQLLYLENALLVAKP